MRYKGFAVAFGHNTYRNECLLFHSRLRLKSTGNVVKVPYFIPLIASESDGGLFVIFVLYDDAGRSGGTVFSFCPQGLDTVEPETYSGFAIA
jgi:hypothetical protein